MALERTPSLKVPVVARLVGNRFAEARAILAEKRPDIAVEEMLDAALNRVDAILKEPRDDRPALAQHTGHRAGRHRPHRQRARPAHAGVRHQHRRRRIGACGAGSVEGVPVFSDCGAAVAATGARVSVVMVPPYGVLAAAEDAMAAGIELIVTVAEGVPVHDALRVGRIVRDAGAIWVGASTPGLAVPGEMKLGFLPNVSLRPGPLGLMSKSGTLSYETGYRLARWAWPEHLGRRRRRSGQGRALPRSVRHVPRGRRTRGIVLIGEVGGTEEEDFADALAAPTPQAGLCAGRRARRQGRRAMGHAGALTFGNVGTFEIEAARLEAAGVRVFASIDDLVAACGRDARLTGFLVR